MTRIEIMHIEYLQEMLESENEEWAKAAHQELKELKDEYAKKGIFII